MSQQIRELQDYFNRTGKELDAAIARLQASVIEEQKYTQLLIKKAKKPEPTEAIAPPPKPTKAEEIAKMSDSDLLKAMSNPKTQKELFEGLK